MCTYIFSTLTFITRNSISLSWWVKVWVFFCANVVEKILFIVLIFRFSTSCRNILLTAPFFKTKFVCWNFFKKLMLLFAFHHLNKSKICILSQSDCFQLVFSKIHLAPIYANYVLLKELGLFCLFSLIP